jgi:hypothetical protein
MVDCVPGDDHTDPDRTQGADESLTFGRFEGALADCIRIVGDRLCGDPERIVSLSR